MKSISKVFVFVSICSLLASSYSQARADVGSHIALANEPVPCSTTYATTAKQQASSSVCLVPKASNTVVYQNALAAIDASNASEGYVMVNYKGSNPKVKLQITSPAKITYTYNLHGGYETFPLSSGNGSYTLVVYENVTGNQYSTALSQSISVNITNTFGPFLYPNQYVNFTAASYTVAKGAELASGCSTDLDIVSNIYDYITNNITYDYNKANSLPSGYTANVDDILLKGTGICLDYTAVMASMLRSQGIPTRLEVGYASTAYHAWISTYIEDIGWVNGIIQFDGTGWTLIDPTFAASTDPQKLKNFIGDGSNYTTKYIY